MNSSRRLLHLVPVVELFLLIVRHKFSDFLVGFFETYRGAIEDHVTQRWVMSCKLVEVGTQVLYLFGPRLIVYSCHRPYHALDDIRMIFDPVQAVAVETRGSQSTDCDAEHLASALLLLLTHLVEGRSVSLESSEKVLRQ